MTATKERIIGAVSLMNDKEAEFFWKMIQSRYIIAPKTWDNNEEVEPDEIDLMLLDEIRKNPECHEFVSQEELMKELEMN